MFGYRFAHHGYGRAVIMHCDLVLCSVWTQPCLLKRVCALLSVPPDHTADIWLMQGSEYTNDGRDSHPSPGGTSRSDVSPQQLTAGGFDCGFVGSTDCAPCCRSNQSQTSCLRKCRLLSQRAPQQQCNTTLPFDGPSPLALSHGCGTELQLSGMTSDDQSRSPLLLPLY